MSLFSFITTNPPRCQCDAKAFVLGQPGIGLYDTIAQRLAEDLAKPRLLVKKKTKDQGRHGEGKEWEDVPGKEENKPAQIRKFYDELCMWEQKAKDEKTFGELLPLIKMMNAKVAYARGRGLVDDQFVAWFSCCMAQIRAADADGLETFRNFRTHFEAFLGFYKQARPS